MYVVITEMTVLPALIWDQTQPQSFDNHMQAVTANPCREEKNHPKQLFYVRKTIQKEKPGNGE